MIQGSRPGRDLQPLAFRVGDEMLRAIDGKGFAFSKKLAHHKIADAQKQYMNTYWMGLQKNYSRKY